MKISKDQNLALLKSYNPDVTFFKSGAISKLAGTAINALAGGGIGDIASSTQGMLIEQQQELQLQMMLTSMQSNVLRTEHESKMAAVRNMRVA